MSSRDIDSTSENVLHDWANEEEASQGELAEQDELAVDSSEDESPAWGSATAAAEPADPTVVEGEEEEEEGEDEEEQEEPDAAEPESGDAEPAADATGIEIDETPMQVELSHEHAAGDLHIPDGYAVLEGVAEGGRRAVGVVVSRFNGSITTQLLDGALAELSAAGVRQDAITIMVVPGAFELPLAATALAKTRRFACIVALGCVIRGDTPHFEYVSSEAASGLQLAALETGVPVAFGVLTLDRLDQAEARVGKGAEAVRSALEMADLFAHLRAAAAR
jgi:6,7-dimethyl-8-ribityllumazine synthase